MLSGTNIDGQTARRGIMCEQSSMVKERAMRKGKEENRCVRVDQSKRSNERLHIDLFRISVYIIEHHVARACG